MARQRFIHPDFWTDPDVGKLTPIERLLFIGCFSTADDEGRLLGDPAYLRSMIFPYDDMKLSEIRAMRDRAVSLCKNLVLYEVNGVAYLAFRHWRRYQNPRYPKASKLPPPPDSPAPNSPQPCSDTDANEPQPCGQDAARLQPDGNCGLGRDGLGRDGLGSTPPDPPEGDSGAEAPPDLDVLLASHERYSPEQIALIREYWDLVRFTRKTGQVAPTVIARELEYWARFPPDVVAEALTVHVRRYQGKREDYTRGIMRRVVDERQRGVGGQPASPPRRERNPWKH